MSDGFTAIAITMVVCVIFGAALLVFARKESEPITVDDLRECLAHQQWCIEHYKLEEGK